VDKLLGGLLLLVAAVAGLIGVLWLFLDAVGTEWDYCDGGGGDCISGWKMGAAFTFAAVVAGVVGVSLLRRERHGSRSGDLT
jgi:hypothetical protein